MNKAVKQFTKKNSIKGMTSLIALFFFTINVHAAEISGVTFTDIYQEEGIKMELQGTGLKTVVFFKAFAAGFYRDNLNNVKILGEFPKRIEVEYFVNVPAEKLNHYTIDRMKDNTTKSEFSKIQDEVTLMNNYFVDLEPGDRFSLTYIPGVGTKFAHNDQWMGTIQGSDFAKALFSVWIGEKPFDHKIKEEILGFKKKI